MDFRVRGKSRIRPLPRPEDGLRVLVEHAPQAEAFADRILLRFCPTLTKLYESRRRLATAGVVILTSWLFLHVMFGANGMVVYRQKRAEYQRLETELNQLQKENDHYTQQIERLKTDPKTIEKEAREQLHYTRPGEVVYVTPVPANPEPARSDAAKK